MKNYYLHEKDLYENNYWYEQYLFVSFTIRFTFSQIIFIVQRLSTQ